MQFNNYTKRRGILYGLHVRRVRLGRKGEKKKNQLNIQQVGSRGRRKEEKRCPTSVSHCFSKR